MFAFEPRCQATRDHTLDERADGRHVVRPHDHVTLPVAQVSAIGDFGETLRDHHLALRIDPRRTGSLRELQPRAPRLGHRLIAANPNAPTCNRRFPSCQPIAWISEPVPVDEFAQRLT